MKTTTIRTDLPTHMPAARGHRRLAGMTGPSRNVLSALPHRAAVSQTRKGRNILGMHWLVGKILLLSAVVLMVIAVMQKPSMLLLFLMPTAIAATAVRLFMGLLVAAAIKACVPSFTRPTGPPVQRLRQSALPQAWCG